MPVYKVLHNMAPIKRNEIFNMSNTIHHYNLRRTDTNLFLPRPKTEYLKNILVLEDLKYGIHCLEKLKQDACIGVHSACQREENGHNLDICVLRRLRLRQGQMQGFLGLKVGGGA